MIRFALIAAGLAAAMAAPGAAAAPIAGQWKTNDGKAIITIAPCGANMCGTITRFLVPEPAGGARDDKNPNAAQRSRALLGLTILTGLSVKGENWTGSGYSPEEGRNFRATLTPSGNRLRIKGCVAVFCRSMVWSKVA